MSCDRMNINRSWDHMQQKYVGTGFDQRRNPFFFFRKIFFQVTAI